MVETTLLPIAEPALAGPLVRYFPGSARSEHNGRAFYGTVVTGSILVVEFMKLVGVDIIFGIPGGNSLPLSDALTHGHVGGAFRYVLTGHEQGAAFEAEGYAAASGKVGFCTATSGPGGTNLITGLADAFRDSRPVVAITGNSATAAEPEAFQALDIVGITNGRATKGAFQPRDVREVQETLVRAYHLAVTGRPGSVLIDLPKDVQIGNLNMKPWEPIIEQFDWDAPVAASADVAIAARWLTEAERPLLYVGNGAIAANATPEIRELSQKYRIPIATTVHALGVAGGHPLDLGMIGMHGTVVSNLAAHRCDVLVALGARFDDRVASAFPTKFGPEARIVHVDVDASQLNRVRQADLAIHGDVKAVARRLLDVLADGPAPSDSLRQPWLDELAAIRQAMPVPSNDRPESDALNHEIVYQTIAEVLRDRDIVDVVATFDVGTHQMKGTHWFPVVNPRSFITSGGMGSMGCSLPMAAGASLARPDALVLAAVGDGGFVMSSHELDTIGGYRLPVKIVLFDDAHLGMVTNWHSLFFEGRKLTSDRRRDRVTAPVDLDDLKRRLHDAIELVSSEDELTNVLGEATRQLADSEWPAFGLTAAAYGIPSERIHTKQQLRGAIERMLATEGPFFLHVELSQQGQMYPLVPPGREPRDIVWRETEPGSGEVIRVADRYDYDAGRLRGSE
jgi:acetolactate synthase-1/2/3 large subunit